MAANPTCQAPTQIRTVENWFNECAFAEPAAEPFGPAFGTEGRNALIGPGYTDLDLGLSKNFHLRPERQQIQFRGDVFNLLNHPNFDVPNHEFDLTACGPSNSQLCPAANYGALTSANFYGNKPPRQIQVSFRYTF